MMRNRHETRGGERGERRCGLKPRRDGHGTITGTLYEERRTWGCPMSGSNVRRERRDTSPAGKWNRRQFETSLKLLRVIGLSPRALEFCTGRGRATQRLPHEILVEMFEEAIALEDAVIWRATSPAVRND